jgi:hypothetical protein
MKLYTGWKYVEEAAEPLAGTAREAALTTPAQEIRQLREAVAREEKNLTDFRRFRCHSLARQAEASIRNLTSRIRALELGC